MKRMTLEWKSYDGYQEAIVGAQDTDSDSPGHFRIALINRPSYCDRGKFHVLVDNFGCRGLDCQEGFPRYYFSEQRAKEEMQEWVNERDVCKNFIVKNS